MLLEQAKNTVLPKSSSLAVSKTNKSTPWLTSFLLEKIVVAEFCVYQVYYPDVIITLQTNFMRNF